MPAKYFIIGLNFLFTIIPVPGTNNSIRWIRKDCKFYSINYTTHDDALINEYQDMIFTGLKKVEAFFDSPYKKKFEVFIYPNRQALDSAWAKDWDSPGFKSECWMVASGIADKIDILSPIVWSSESCEHDYLQREQTQQVITHELVHVFHGQLNPSPDFSNVKNMDWLVEGLAVYASGQCDSNRITGVINAIKNNSIPSSIDQFWTGEFRYGLSGALVMFIDKKYGRNKLKELLVYDSKQKILDHLGTEETDLLTGWKEFMLSLQ